MKKKKIFRRILVLTLVLCQFIGVLALTGCKKEQEPGTTDTTGQSENTGDTTGPSGNKNEELPVDVKELTIVEDGKTDYVIIRSQTAKQWEINAAVRFRDTIKALTGVEIPLKDDFEREGTEYQRTEKEILIETLFFEDEIKEMPKEPAKPELAESELTMAKTLIESMVKPFEPAQYHDEYQARLKQIIEDKIAGKEIVEAPKERTDNVIDLMVALEASLQQIQDDKPKKRTTRKKASSA